MKKNLVLALLCMFAFVFGFSACSSGSSGKKSGFYQNNINGNMVEFYSTANHDNSGSNDKNVIFFVQGETFPLKAVLLEALPSGENGYFMNENHPELVNSFWKVSGNIGYLNAEGSTSGSGATTTFTAGAAGTSGNISIELNGLKCTYPIKIVASQSELPED